MRVYVRGGVKRSRRWSAMSVVKGYLIRMHSSVGRWSCRWDDY